MSCEHSNFVYPLEKRIKNKHMANQSYEKNRPQISIGYVYILQVRLYYISHRWEQHNLNCHFNANACHICNAFTGQKTKYKGSMPLCQRGRPPTHPSTFYHVISVQRIFLVLPSTLRSCITVRVIYTYSIPSIFI